MASPVELRSVQNWQSAWRASFLPWLREAAEHSMLEKRPTMVLAPDLAALRFARSIALEAGVNAPAIQFATPSQLRDHLVEALGIRTKHPLRETLRLLLATAAEQHAGEAAAAVAAGPDGVLHGIDLLGAAGWNFADAAPAAVRPIIAEFDRLRQACGFSLLHETDAALVRAADQREPTLARLCVIGFDAAHWNLWPLLASAVHSSSSALIHLRLPREEAQDFDALWLGTWEQEFGPYEPLHLPDQPELPLQEASFLVGEDTAEQAAAVVQQATAFLADPSCTRLAILVPGPGALARRIAAELTERGLPHFDGIGHPLPGDAQAEDWIAWLDLQENPRLPALLRFVRAFSGTAELFGGCAPERVTELLSRLFRELLLDDLDLLASYSPELGDGLRAIPRLPETATFAEFVTATALACEALGWCARAAELRRQVDRWAPLLRPKISLRIYLRWLREVLTAPGRERLALGNHPYSRTHLLPASQAGSQAWSHVIVAGLNQGAWPPPFDESGWIAESTVADLNERVRVLNRRSRRQGRQGEGHETITPGKALCLGPAQRRVLALRDFCFAVEAAKAAAFAASLLDESAPERVSNPSDFLTRIYNERLGAALSSRTMRALRQQTADWLAASPGRRVVAAQRETAVQHAYAVRRDRTKEFGEYEFSLRTPPSTPPCLNATEWENALKAPSLTWMNRFLGVSQNEDLSKETPWAAAVGTWVHRWLSQIGGRDPQKFATLPQPGEIRTRVMQAAARFRDAVLATGKPLPEWWLATWGEAHQMALALAEQISRVNARYTQFATERSLPDSTFVQIDADTLLGVRGRIDLLLAAAPDDLWVVDFKTGKKGKLTVPSPTKVEGLQLVLYALALEEHGARSVGMSRLSPPLTLDEPQLDLAKAGRLALAGLWQGLAQLAARGAFGQRGTLRDEYSFSDDHPLATLRIEPEILEEKWQRTHPLLANHKAE